MKNALRNRVILLALVLLIGQLTLVVHATVHDAEINCQLCLNQNHHSKILPVTKLIIPPSDGKNSDLIKADVQKPLKTFPNAYLQRGPPVTL
jgi:hypothetical protein